MKNVTLVVFFINATVCAMQRPKKIKNLQFNQPTTFNYGLYEKSFNFGKFRYLVGVNNPKDVTSFQTVILSHTLEKRRKQLSAQQQ